VWVQITLTGGYQSQYRQTKNLRNAKVDTSGGWFTRNDGINETPTIPLLESFLSYNKEISSIKSRIDAVAGYSYQTFLTTDYAFPGLNGRGVQVGGNPVYPVNENENTLISFFGRMNYSLANKVFVDSFYS
jgi:iron complex outermembrane receptor protein